MDQEPNLPPQPSGRSASFSSLPLELFEPILEYLTSPQDLANLSQTCKSFHPFVARKLYKCPINTETPMRNFGKVERALAGDNVKYVRDIAICAYMTFGRTKIDLIPFLDRCSELETLSVMLETSEDMDSLTRLPPLHMEHRLRELTVDLTLDNDFEDDEVLESSYEKRAQTLYRYFIAIFKRYSVENLRIVSYYPLQGNLGIVYDSLMGSFRMASFTSLTINNFPPDWRYRSPYLRERFPSLKTINYIIPYTISLLPDRDDQVLQKFDAATLLTVVRSERQEGWEINFLSPDGRPREIILDQGEEWYGSAGLELVQWLEKRQVQVFCNSGSSASMIAACKGRVFFQLGTELSNTEEVFEIRSLFMQSQMYEGTGLYDEWHMRFIQGILSHKNLRSFRQRAAVYECSKSVPDFGQPKEVSFDARRLRALANLTTLVNLELDLTGCIIGITIVNLSDVKNLKYFETTTNNMARIYDKSFGYLPVLLSRRFFSAD
jgi:hypothetical protein